MVRVLQERHGHQGRRMANDMMAEGAGPGGGRTANPNKSVQLVTSR